MSYKSVLISIALIAFASIASSSDNATRPNVLFITVDDLGVMDLGAYNPQTFYDTPHIDSLADSGVRFDQGYTSSPICSPARYTLMTGKYPTRVQVTDWFVKNPKRPRWKGHFLPAETTNRMSVKEITIADLLKAEGYNTYFIGKWHLGPSEEFYPQKQGFDVNQGGHFRGGPYTGNNYFSPFEMPELEPDSPLGDHLPDRLAREAVGFMQESGDEPFLICLNFYSVHDPIQGRPDLVEKYQAKEPLSSGPIYRREEWVPRRKRNGQLIEEGVRKLRIVQSDPEYAAMVEAMDLAVGKVLDNLETLGLADNTLVILTSDHGGMSTLYGGPTSNEPYRAGKGWLYEGGLRVPYIVRYPGVSMPGHVSDSLVNLLDFYPLVASAVGAKPRHLVDGVDITPALKGATVDRRAFYWHYPHYSPQGGFPGGAILEGDYKLIQRYEDGRVHLYNLVTDPSETQDISDKKPELTERMLGKLHIWLKEQNAQFLRKYPEEGSPEPWQPDFLGN